jgi:CDP-paratose 2-epimerase
MIDSILITGGAGFIGAHSAHHFLKQGKKVLLVDNLSREGSELNLAWLKREHGDRFTFFEADVRKDFALLQKLVEEVDAVLHLAAQVAVTTSVQNPREDFEINALGALNVLEAIRLSQRKPMALYSSTNKVYGGMEDLAVVEENGRYAYQDQREGVSEERPLDFHSPYGCSKGSADQYFHDYARIYGLRTVVFRQSCIYGTHQFGVEDQGWVAWFAIAATQNRPITLYGDGKQVRDVLFVEDLVRCYECAMEKIDIASGQVYNVGGGPTQVLSLLELLALLEKRLGEKIPFTFDAWRPGDQKVFVCDIRKAERELGWKPQVDIESGVERLIEWIASEPSLFDFKREPQALHPNPTEQEARAAHSHLSA